jgi:hypothetical protein
LGWDKGPPSGGFGDGVRAVGEPPESYDAVEEGYYSVEEEHPDISDTHG